jgi:hypothetical protein
MLFCAAKSRRRLSLDGSGYDLNVLTFAFSSFFCQTPRLRRSSASVNSFSVNLMNARSRNIGECEVRVLRDRPIERFAGTSPSGKDKIQSFAIRSRRGF